ncbi:MAG: GNAT family N-acetyltransferase [Deltaproteobacteria bacterium]|nr:GNAT family N-acetyltransferase [Deltaproteobacteria bacterium]
MELKTKRFLLRDFIDADIAAFETYHNDQRSREFYGTEESTPEHARELITLFKAWAEAQPRVNYQLAIIQRGAPQALIGCCGVRCANSEPGTGELGIELAPEYWGRYAYANEVMLALAEFGFNTLGLQMIYGETVSANSRVARLVSSIGATAIIRPTPAWMASKGWTQVEWQITRQQWESVRRTLRSSGPPSAAGEL